VEKFAGFVVVARLFLNEDAVHSCRFGESGDARGDGGQGKSGLFSCASVEVARDF
jgi:hypothetical protein